MIYTESAMAQEASLPFDKAPVFRSGYDHGALDTLWHVLDALDQEGHSDAMRVVEAAIMFHCANLVWTIVEGSSADIASRR